MNRFRVSGFRFGISNPPLSLFAKGESVKNFMRPSKQFRKISPGPSFPKRGTEKRSFLNGGEILSLYFPSL
jgi:hypothetical protein